MRLFSCLALLALPMLGPRVAAQTQSPASAPRPVSYPGVSPEGNAIIAKLNQQGDPALLQLIRQQKAARDQLSNAIMVATIDTSRIATIMKQLDLLQSQIRARSSERVLAALNALPEADRGPFLRAIARQVGPAAN